MSVQEGRSNDNPRHLISTLIASVAFPGLAPQTQNPLKQATSNNKNLLLTCYALFEKELLPALDCLDRGLVTRLKISESATKLYMVRSAQQHHTRHGATENGNFYDVRLDSWSCSCPAFTFSAFPVSSEGNDDDAQEACIFGGFSKGTDLPVCKHILACVLVANCDGFEGFVDEREVSKEEFAGWAAGWGD